MDAAILQVHHGVGAADKDIHSMERALIWVETKIWGNERKIRKTGEHSENLSCTCAWREGVIEIIKRKTETVAVNTKLTNSLIRRPREAKCSTGEVKEWNTQSIWESIDRALKGVRQNWGRNRWQSEEEVQRILDAFVRTRKGTATGRDRSFTQQIDRARFDWKKSPVRWQ